jgi:Protein of unknown function (DUF3237)
VAHTLHLIQADVKGLSRAARGESGVLAIEPARRPRRQASARRWIDARNRNRPADANMSSDERQLPDPRLRKVYRPEVTLGEPRDLSDVAQGHRRIVPQTGGTFTGPEISGKLLPGASADIEQKTRPCLASARDPGALPTEL